MTEEITNYLGENLFLGNLGHSAVVLAFTAAILGFIGFYMAHKNEQQSTWHQIAKAAFWVHGISVMSIFVILYWLIQGHYYEYQYVWQHSSNELPKYYMISCFWEGQEGSFLLWMFWHVILSLFIYFRPSILSKGALAIIMLVQAVLASMLLGVEFFGQKIGSSPFALLREVQPDILSLPAVKMRGVANYLEIITDGSGLNPLLQNYWMVIHPPTLFLGFASATIPFAFLVAAFWIKDSTFWMRPLIPWTLFSVMILGTGIIMGGFWAYEALSFGGYWAWDPVENASLMPWILLIAAVHMVLIYKNTGQYAVLTILLVCFSFFMVLYATFLTRSGVLGEASVHSFTDLGLSGQLLLFIFVFIFIAIYASFHRKKHAAYLIAGLLAAIILNVVSYHYNLIAKPILNTLNLLFFGIVIFAWVKALRKQFPEKVNQEKPSTREFWMFIGSLVLLLSAFQIIFYTSAPVFNKLFDLNLAVQKEEFYNRFQLPFAILIAFLTAFGQFFNYRKTDMKAFWKAQRIPIIISVITSVLLMFYWDLMNLQKLAYAFLLLTSIYAITSNATYLLSKLKGKLKIGGASIAHAGFGIMMVGILISSVNKNVISYNNIGQNFVEADVHDKKATDFNRNNMLLKRGDTVSIQEFKVVYDTNYIDGVNKTFEVKWLRFGKDATLKEKFVLKPNAQNNPQFGLVANPDTRHYLSRDIYTHITHESSLETAEEFKNFKKDTVTIGQEFTTESGMRKVKVVSLDNFSSEDGKTIKIEAALEVSALGKPVNLNASLIIDLATNGITRQDAQSDEEGFLGSLVSIIPTSEPLQIVIQTAERRPIIDYIIMTAVEFPWINLLWSGTIILVIGFVLSILQRTKEMRKWKTKS